MSLTKIGNKNKIPRTFAFDNRIQKDNFIKYIDPEDFSLNLVENNPELFS